MRDRNSARGKLDPWKAELIDLFEPLWKLGLGDPKIKLALLDGVINEPPDAIKNSPGTRLDAKQSQGSETSGHATWLAELIFSGLPGLPCGLAQGISAISLPIFVGSGCINLDVSSEELLAASINKAVSQGAHIINISASYPSPKGEASSAMRKALLRAEKAGVLIVAATGNRGSMGLSLPASADSVLAVSALTATGEPAPFAGMSSEYGPNAVFSLGLEGAPVSGTSAATAIVSSFAALLLSAQVRKGQQPRPLDVRSFLVDTAVAINASIPFGKIASQRLVLEPSLTSQKTTSITEETEDFGITQVQTFSGQTYAVPDLQYTLPNGNSGAQVLTINNESHDETRVIDELLRSMQSLKQDAPLYALLTYTRPDEKYVHLRNLLKTYKRRLGCQHIGSYLGKGLTSQALPKRALKDWTRKEKYYGLNLENGPAHVHTLSLKGVNQEVINTNLQIVDRLTLASLTTPDNTETLTSPVYNLATCLDYYVSMLRDENLPNTNCADHVFLVVNLGVNLPHNPQSFSQIFGEMGIALWEAFEKKFFQAYGRAFVLDDQTHFVPLWKMAETDSGAFSESSSENYPGTRASAQTRLKGLVWPPETIADQVFGIVDTYTHPSKTSSITQALLLEMLAPLVVHITKLSNSTVNKLLRSIQAAYMQLEQASSEIEAALWRAASEAELQSSLKVLMADTHDVELIHQNIASCIEEVYAQQLKSSGSPEYSNNAPLEEALSQSWSRFKETIELSTVAPPYFHTPSVVSRVSAGRYPSNPNVSVRTLFTMVNGSQSSYFHPSVTAPHIKSSHNTSAPAKKNIAKENHKMSQPSNQPSEQPLPSERTVQETTRENATSEHLCDCQNENDSPSQSLVYALGRIGYDVASSSRRDALEQVVPGVLESPKKLVEALKNRPWLAHSIQWLLLVEQAPIYVLQPEGPYARDTYELLREFLSEQVNSDVERISVPGSISGTVQLRAGFSVPVVNPDINGMYNWTTSALVEKITQKENAKNADKRERIAVGVTHFLERVYFELRNPGQGSRERAINFSATNAFQLEHVFKSALEAELELDLIDVEPNPLARPGSDCWDVKLTFFSPTKTTSRKVFRFTVDVSDVLPVRIGEVRSWFIR